MSIRMLAAICSAALVCSALAPESFAVSPAPAPPEAPPKRPWAASPVKLPTIQDGKITRSVEAEGVSVRLELTDQVIAVYAPQSESWRRPGEFQAGDAVTITAATTPLVEGSNKLGAAARGEQVSVLEVKDQWLRVGSPVAGKKGTGWIAAKDVKLVGSEALLLPTIPPHSPGQPISAAVLLQKAKQFDDGLYAAVELAAQEGAGSFAGKSVLLRNLAEKLSKGEATADSPAVRIVLAAAKLGNVAPALPQRLAGAVDRDVRSFLADAARSKPLSFYTWSDPLTAIFRQDRMLQSPLTDAAGVAQIVQALRSDERHRATYESYLNLISRLTNPLVGDDLRARLGDGAAATGAGAPPAFFPPSRSHEAELIKRLYGDRPIPEGFELMTELVRRIAEREIDLAPQENSGWYDYQTWSLEPLVVPLSTAEAAHLQFDQRYRDLLVELFKGALALARETHVKQLELPPAAAEAPVREKPKPKVFIHPELSVEPLASVFDRRARSYQFVRGVLEETFGPGALAGMHRLTAAGPVEANLADELQTMHDLFQGASTTAFLQVGLPAVATERAEVAAQTFLDWAANLDHDADVSQDCRMMVPVFYDLRRKQTKVWMVLGWNTQGVGFDFAKTPAAVASDNSGKTLAADEVEIHYHGQWSPLAYPVVAEAYVSQILDRQEFRRHCDQYQTRSAILRNLK